MITSPSSMETYRRCKFKWDFSSSARQNLTKIVNAPALNLGTLVHAALDDWLKDASCDPAVQFCLHADDMLNEIRATYKAQIGVAPSTRELDPVYEIVELGKAMMTNYRAHYGTPLPTGYKLVQTEQTVIVGVPGTPHQIQVRLDAVIMDRYERLFVLDHKTYGSRPRGTETGTSDTWETLPQFTTYHWALRALNIGDVGGVCVNGLWKRAVPPKTVDKHPGTMKDLFHRQVITHNHHVLAAHEAHLIAQVTEMAGDPHIYPHRTSDGSCYWGCSYETLCRSVMEGEDSAHILRSSYKKRPPTLLPDQDVDLD